MIKGSDIMKFSEPKGHVGRNKSVTGKIAISKKSGRFCHKRTRTTCFVDPGTFLTAAAAVSAVVSTAILVSDKIKAGSRKKCTFYFAARKKFCNRPIIDNGYCKEDGKRYKYSVCDQNHFKKWLLHESQSKK